MPTYGYECKTCGHSFDIFQAMSDEPLKICPECGKEIRRLINGGNGVIFRGGGFYVTDKGGGGKSDTKAAGDSANSAKPADSVKSCPGCAKSDSCPKAANS